MRLPAAIAGAVAVAVGLAVVELAAQFVDGVPSLVTAVGSLVVPVVPPAIEDWAIAMFGTSDKGVLAAGTVVVTLAIGAVAGLRGRHDRGSAATIVAIVAAVGVLASVVQPLVAVVPTLLVDGVAVTLAWGILRASWALLARWDRTPEQVPAAGDPTNPAVARRQFLALAAGGGTAAVAMTAGARAIGMPPTSSAAAASLTLPDPRAPLPAPADAQVLDVDGLTPVLVPNDRFYRIDTALRVPRIDTATWRLRIHGMVDRELELTWEDLLDRTFTERDVTLACVSNEVGGDLIGTARWLGTPLADLLREAGAHAGATQVVGRAVDGWTAGFPTDAVGQRDAFVAIGMNGEPLPAEHGFPARLVVPGLFGYVSATKWLTEVELATWESFDAYWVPRGWSKEGPIKTQSRIDVPRPGQEVLAGEVVVAGVAWAPTRGVAAVEVRVGDGPWASATLSEPLSESAWVQWRVAVDLPPGDHDLQVRAADGTGGIQPPGPVPPRPDGAEGWHTVLVRARPGTALSTGPEGRGVASLRLPTDRDR